MTGSLTAPHLSLEVIFVTHKNGPIHNKYSFLILDPTHQSLLKGAIFFPADRTRAGEICGKSIFEPAANQSRRFKLEKRLTRREVFIYLLIICKSNLHIRQRDCSSNVRLIQIMCKERSTPYKPQMLFLSLFLVKCLRAHHPTSFLLRLLASHNIIL